MYVRNTSDAKHKIMDGISIAWTWHGPRDDIYTTLHFIDVAATTLGLCGLPTP